MCCWLWPLHTSVQISRTPENVHEQMRRIENSRNVDTVPEAVLFGFLNRHGRRSRVRGKSVRSGRWRDETELESFCAYTSLLKKSAHGQQRTQDKLCARKRIHLVTVREAVVPHQKTFALLLFCNIFLQYPTTRSAYFLHQDNFRREELKLEVLHNDSALTLQTQLVCAQLRWSARASHITTMHIRDHGEGGTHNYNCFTCTKR